MQHLFVRLILTNLFQIIPLSESLMLAMSFHRAFIFWIPSCMTGPVLKTAAWVCIVFCILSLISALPTSPAANLSLSMLATEASPAFSDRGPMGSPGLESSAIVLAQARPKITLRRRYKKSYIVWTELSHQVE